MEKDNLELILEDIREKFDLVLEGHSALNRKIDTVYQNLAEKIDDNSFKINVLNQKIDDVDARLSRKIDEVDARLSEKIDAVAADLAAHRADTESHGKGYKVSE